MQYPEYFKKAAKRAWDNAIKQLGKVEDCDMGLFEEYCYQFDVIDSLRDELKKGAVVPITNNGGGNSMIKNPAFTVYADAYERIKTTAILFGITPAGRKRLGIVKKENTSADENIGKLKLMRKAV